MKWITHDGEQDPNIPGDTRVQVLFRDGDTGYGVMHDWDQNWQWAWLDDNHDGDIVAYKVMKPVAPADVDATEGVKP